MGRIILGAIALYVAIFCGNYARTCFKEKNKLGGIAISVMSLLALASPFIYFMMVR
ncbi:hypothetical protein [Radiobacillus sp. PE A8.2]|uniref:hypothetical protein n=1 Tax=Radiobacillus sp. PE A8.2 TaxID=3380349 RepID=UPI00388F947B